MNPLFFSLVSSFLREGAPLAIATATAYHELGLEMANPH